MQRLLSFSLLLCTALTGPTVRADSFYVSYQSANVIEKLNPNGSITSSITPNFSGPIGLALDGAGNLYASIFQNNSIEKYSPAGVDLGAFGSTGAHSAGPMVFDSAGILYANIGFDGSIRKYGPGGGAGTVFATLGNHGSWGMAFDQLGFLYVAEGSLGDVKKISPNGAVITTFIPGGSPNFYVTDPTALLFDAAGNLYVADGAANVVKKFSSVGTFLGTFASSPNLQQPSGMTFDSGGNLYVVNAANTLIEKFSSTGVDLGIFANPGVGGAQQIVMVPEPSLVFPAGVLLFALTIRRRRVLKSY